MNGEGEQENLTNMQSLSKNPPDGTVPSNVVNMEHTTGTHQSISIENNLKVEAISSLEAAKLHLN